MKLLLVGAFGPEIEPFSAHLPAGVVARAVGIGLVASALGAARAISETGAGGVVFVGTCGAFEGSGLAIGDVVVARDSVLADGGVATRRGHLLPTLAAPIPGDTALADALAPGLSAVRVATTLAVTTDDAAAADLARAFAADVEHLEAYAVAAAAAHAGVPFTAVLGIANMVGSRGRGEWLAHHAAASAAVRDALLPGLRRAAFRPLLRGSPPTTL